MDGRHRRRLGRSPATRRGPSCLSSSKIRANPDVHYRVTSAGNPPRDGRSEGRRFVAAVGTGGTVSGVGRALREAVPECRVIAVEPETCATISRGERGPTKIQGIAAGFVPKNYDPATPHEVRTVTDERAWNIKRLLARSEGLLVGISAGANVAIALDLARELGPEKNVVTVLCDTGERYFSLDEYFETRHERFERHRIGEDGPRDDRGRGRSRLSGGHRFGSRGSRHVGAGGRRSGRSLEPASPDPVFGRGRGKGQARGCETKPRPCGTTRRVDRARALAIPSGKCAEHSPGASTS